MESTNSHELTSVTITAPELRRHKTVVIQRARAGLTAAVSAVGPLVLDTRVTYPGPVPETGKRKCEMHCSYGGGALNSSRAIRAAGGAVVPGFLIGRDKLGQAMKDELGDEFARAQFAEAYQASRQSHIRPDGLTDTTRPPLELTSVPKHIRHSIQQSSVMIVGPMAVTDHAFVAVPLLHVFESKRHWARAV